MNLKSIAKVLIIFTGVHVYIFLTAFVYHVLESKTVPKKSQVEVVLDKYFYKPGVAENRPNKSSEDTPRSTANKIAVVKALKNAFEKDSKNKIKSEFSSLWKAYLFSLTTIATVGNSGLYLQSIYSQLFFFFSTAIGTVLYVILLHHIAVLLLEILIQAVQFEFMKNHDKPHWSLRKPIHAIICVLLLSYCLILLTILITAIAVVVSGHGYAFGLCAVTDSVLAIGNYHMLAYLYPWNEGGFVISINVILLLCHTFLYTTILATYHFVRGTKWEDLVERFGGDNDMYKPLAQDEEGPYKKFLSHTMKKTDLDEAESVSTEVVEDDRRSGKKKSAEKGEVIGESVVPTLLSPEEEEFWENTRSEETHASQ